MAGAVGQRAGGVVKGGVALHHVRVACPSMKTMKLSCEHCRKRRYIRFPIDTARFDMIYLAFEAQHERCKPQ